MLKKGFAYTEKLFIGRVSPDNGAIAGGTYVTVLGTGFGPGLSVLFGGALLKDQRIVDAHTVVGHTPPGRVGAADVKVQIGASSDVSLGAFSYFDPTSGGGGSTGGPLNGTLNVTVLQSSWLHYGQPLPGATVMLGSDPTTLFQGKTDRLGQITFSDPQLMKSQTVTISKDGFQTLTIASQESQNLTVYLSSTTGDGSPPDMPEPGGSTGPAVIAGHVTGFKLPRPLASHERAWAEVWVANTSLYNTPPFGYRATPDQRDARGERWKITADGGAFSVYTSAGLRAVYAVYGIYDLQKDLFTPYLLGVRRGVNAESQPAAGGQGHRARRAPRPDLPGPLRGAAAEPRQLQHGAHDGLRLAGARCRGRHPAGLGRHDGRGRRLRVDAAPGRQRPALPGLLSRLGHLADELRLPQAAGRPDQGAHHRADAAAAAHREAGGLVRRDHLLAHGRQPRRGPDPAERLQDWPERLWLGVERHHARRDALGDDAAEPLRPARRRRNAGRPESSFRCPSRAPRASTGPTGATRPWAVTPGPSGPTRTPTSRSSRRSRRREAGTPDHAIPPLLPAPSRRCGAGAVRGVPQRQEARQRLSRRLRLRRPCGVPLRRRDRAVPVQDQCGLQGG
ncbi:MAG: IPT/TIG domain-containing protein [Myxococcales bacterium]